MEIFLQMSVKELTRLEVMQKLSDKGMSQKEAGEILKVGERQIKRLLKKFKKHGAAGLMSKHRGRPSKNCLAKSVIKQALDFLKSKYQGFGPTLAHEKLTEKEKIKISLESVRQLMIAEGLWKSRKIKKIVTHQLRERRAGFGELVQIDGSPHDWFEGRAEACVLLAFIDDATGKLVQLRFVDSESFFSYSQAAEAYFQRCGKPVAFYSDKPQHFPSKSAQRWLWRRDYPVRTRHARTGYSDYLRQHAASQRARGARLSNFARSPPQRNASTQYLQSRRWKCLSA